MLTTDPATTTTAVPRLFEGGSHKFKAVAKPARVNLPLEVHYDVTTLTGVSVSSRLYTLSKSVGSIPVGTGTTARDVVTLTMPKNDGDREDDELEIHAEVVSFSLNSGAFDDISTSTVKFDAVDIHKLPELTVSPSTGTVKEGGEIELTLMIDRDPANTSSGQSREYTNEEVTVMLTMGAGSTAGATDFSTTSVKFAERTKGLYTAEMKTKVMALADDEIDGGEMLVLDAMLKGSKTENGSEGTSIAGVTTLTIEDETQKLVYAKTPKEVEDAVYAAKKAAEGDDMKFTPGEMMEVMGSALFSAAEGVTVSYSAMSSDSSVASTTVSGGTVMVTAAAEGMADITITAHGMSPAGVKIIDQTDPDAASIMFPVEVGLEALSIELTGPEDMNLVEGGMGGMVTATANRAVTEAVTVMLMRDRSKSSADDMDFEAEPIVIEAGMMTGSTMVMAVEDDMMENDSNMAEELVLYGMTEGMAGSGHRRGEVLPLGCCGAGPADHRSAPAGGLPGRWRLPPLSASVAFGDGVRNSPLPPLPGAPPGGGGFSWGEGLALARRAVPTRGGPGGRSRPSSGASGWPFCSRRGPRSSATRRRSRRRSRPPPTTGTGRKTR